MGVDPLLTLYCLGSHWLLTSICLSDILYIQKLDFNCYFSWGFSSDRYLQYMPWFYFVHAVTLWFSPTVSLSPVSDQTNKPDRLNQFGGEREVGQQRLQIVSETRQPFFFFPPIKLLEQVESIFSVSGSVMQFCTWHFETLLTLGTQNSAHSDTLQGGGAQMYVW